MGDDGLARKNKMRNVEHGLSVSQGDAELIRVVPSDAGGKRVSARAADDSSSILAAREKERAGLSAAQVVCRIIQLHRFDNHQE